MRRTIPLAVMIAMCAGVIFVLALNLIPRSTQTIQSGNSTAGSAVINTPAPMLPKKLIEYGWDVPSPAFVRANIQTMEQRPFDGIVVKLSVGPYIFTHAPIAESSFAQDREDLKATSFSRFADNFLIVWASSEEGWNFLNESDWAAAEQNLRNFARTAAAGGFKGIMFDTETYGPNTWAYNTTIYPNTTFEQMQALVRKRGARFMSILQSELSAVRVLFTWFLGQIRDHYDATGGNIVNGPFPLFSAFVEGMFSAVSGDAKLIDGNEISYGYADAAAFDQSRARLVENINRVADEYREAARAHVAIGQAVYMDGLLNLLNSPRFMSFYIGSQQERRRLVEHNVYHALRTADEYAWFYSEHMDWWKTNGNIPVGLEDALRRARASQISGQLLTYDMGFVEAAKQGLARAVRVFGRITAKGGAPVPHVAMQSGFYNPSGVESACFSDQNNYFECKLPNGWSGPLTPALKGYRFEPSVLEIKNLTQDYHIEIIAIPATP